MNEIELKNKIWGVVHSGSLTFIGAFCDYTLTESGASEDAEGFSSEEAIRQIGRDFALGKIMTLEPVMELAAPLQQVRQQAPDGNRVGVAKSPLPMPYGFTTGRAKLRVRPDAIAFLDEMSEDDRRVYQAFIKSVTKAETAERAARAGITLSPSLNGATRG